MTKNKNSELNILLNAISSEITYNILKLYEDNSFNLTDTAKQLNFSISTIQDNLKKLLQSDLIYLSEKEYHLSSFGNYFLSKLKEFEEVNKLRHLFGKVPSKLIPCEFIEEFIPLLKNVKIKETSWHFLNTFNELLARFKEEIEKGVTTGEIKVLGWWDINFDFEILKSTFPDMTMEYKSLLNLFKNFKFRLISDKRFAIDLINNNLFQDLIQNSDMGEYIRIVEDDINFNFTIMEYEDTLSLFIIENNDIDVKHHVFIQNPNRHIFFNDIFNYYQEKSIPID
ncbi:MAG: winged helix-turn-helix domain-containing protein, partial [Promethearchaeota archaeon]